MEKLNQKIWLRTIKNRFWEKPNSIEEEIELRAITTKKDKLYRKIRNRNKRDKKNENRNSRIWKL